MWLRLGRARLPAFLWALVCALDRKAPVGWHSPLHLQSQSSCSSSSKESLPMGLRLLPASHFPCGFLSFSLPLLFPALLGQPARANYKVQAKASASPYHPSVPAPLLPCSTSLSPLGGIWRCYGSPGVDSIPRLSVSHVRARLDDTAASLWFPRGQSPGTRPYLQMGCV